MASYEEARVLSSRRMGDGGFALVLRSPAASSARPGQFVMLRAPTPDAYLPRPFSVYDANRRRLTVEVLGRVIGAGSRALSALREGDALSVLGPLGSTFGEPVGRPILVAGGVGMPPLHFLAARLRRNDAWAVYGARTASRLYDAARIERRVAKLILATDDGTRGMRGTALEGLVSVLDGRDAGDATVYACGPASMLREVARIADERNLRCEVSVEERMACGVGACAGCAVPAAGGGYALACSDGPVFDSRELAWR